MVVGDNESTATKNQVVNQRQLRLPWQCSGTMRGASTDGAHPGLQSKPLDAAIGQVLAPYHPGGRHGRKNRIKCTNH